MPSLDERRVVASRLREAPVGIESIECLISKNIGLDCDEDCDGLSYQDCEAQILNRLADLIEPEERTCHVVKSVHDVLDSWHYLSCGHRADTWLDDPPKYCPVCGARVEEGK